MKEPGADVFISCSKPQSTEAAKALKQLISATTNLTVYLHVSQSVSGAWLPRLLLRIRKCKVHISCVNRENIDAPWILYEAGVSAIDGLKDDEIADKHNDKQLVLVLDDTKLTDSPFLHFQEIRLDQAHDPPKQRETMHRVLAEIVSKCKAAGKPRARLVPADVDKALDDFLQSLDTALRLPAHPTLQAVGPDQFYDEMRKSIVDAKRLDLINLSPGKISGESYRGYRDMVAQKIGADIPVRRIVAVNEIDRLRELVGELQASRGRVNFHVAMAHESCYASKSRVCPLPASVQIVYRKDSTEVFIVDPANGCHQRSQVSSISFIVDHEKFATAASTYFDNWWKTSEETGLVVKTDDEDILIQPLLDRLSQISQEVDGIPEQTVSDLRAEILAINGAA